MKVAYWIVAGLLGVFYLYAGGKKLVQRKEHLAPMMGWVDTVPMWLVRLIGAIEILGVVGLVLPPLTGHLSLPLMAGRSRALSRRPCRSVGRTTRPTFSAHSRTRRSLPREAGVTARVRRARASTPDGWAAASSARAGAVPR
jgi:hypothetical protein